MITIQPYIKSFHVSFTPSSEYDVVYYKVHATHVDNFVNGDFIPSENNLINEGPETSLLHQVDKGGVWGVKITAVDTFGEDIPNYSGLVTCTVATLDPLDTTAPNVPVFSTLLAAEETGVEAAAVTPNIFIKLAWTLTPVPEDFGTFVLAYKRHTATDWNEQLTEGYSHVFTNMIAGLQYDFKIKAVDKWNNDSAFSVVKTITAAADTVAPLAPTGVTVTPSFGSIRLAWVSPTDLDLKQINVYRNTVNNSSTATKVVSAYGTSYTDAGLLTGTTYYYWLKSEDYSGNVSAAFSSVVSGAPIQIMPTDLDITARVDFVVKDSIFQFTAGTTTLTFTNGSIIRGSSAYTITAGSVANAHNSYVVATLSGSTATISVTPMIGEFPTLTSSQVIIALTSSAPLAGTTNYACYVRQSNSMAIEGAIIRDATITTAKIKDLTADKIGTGTLAVTEYIGVNDDQIKLGNIGTGVTGILMRNLAKTEDVFKVDSTGTATLKNILIDGSVTLGESKILLDGTNSRMTVANASNKNVVTVGKLATGKYGINIKDASEASVLRVDEDGAVIQNLTSGSIDAAKVTIDNLVVGGNVTMGEDAYISWGNVTDNGYRPADNATRNVFVGTWSSSGTYVVGDNVAYLGRTYGCKVTHTASASYLPTNPTYWQLVSDTGQGQVKGVSFIRALTAPATPTGGTFSSPNATTAGWSDGIPADNNQPLWMSTRLFTSDGASPQQSAWSTPQKIGTPSTGSKTQFSVDAVSWHDVPAVNDVYMRTGTSTDNGATWLYSGSVKIKGETGINGRNTAILYLYQRATSTPALPGALLTYTFSTCALTGTFTPWSLTIPAGTAPLYVTAATASSNTDTDSISANEWSAPTILAQNGIDGLNSATVVLYQRGVTATPPTKPSVLSTYTFATGILTGQNNGWGQSVPSTGGDYLFSTTATAVSSTTTDTILSTEWATPAIVSVNGTNGTDGTDAATFRISTAGAAFKKNAAASISPASFTLSTVLLGMTEPAYLWKKDTVTISGATSSSYTVQSSDYNSTTTHTYTCSATGTVKGESITLTDSITIPRLDDGVSAATVLLSNETAVFAAPATGYTGIVFTGGSCAVSAFIGSTALTYGAAGANTFSCTMNVYNATVAAGTGSGTTFSIPAPTAMSADSAYIDVAITVRDAAGTALTPVTRRINFSLSRTGTTGTPGLPGTNGVDALVGYLTNEVVTVASDSSGAGYSLAPAAGAFKLVKGLVDVTNSSSFSGNSTKNGLTLTINSTTGAYTLSGDAWTTDSESFTLQGTYAGTTLSKVFTVTKAKSGATGQNATAYWMVASAAAIQKNSAQTVLTPSSITVTGYRATGTASPSAYPCRFKIYENDVLKTTSASDESSTVFTPTAGVTSVKVEMYLAGGTTTKLDEQTIPVVVDGATGASGTNAIVAVLTNEAHTLPADSNGVVGSFAGCSTTMSVYNGATDDSANWTYSVSRTLGITCTEAATSRTQTVTAMSIDTGTVTITATRSGYASVTKVFTVTKAKSGAIGSTGTAGLNAKAVSLTSTALGFAYNTSGLVPSPGTATLTASAQNTSGTVFYEFLVNGVSKVNSTTSSYTYTPQSSYASMPETIQVKVREVSTTSAVLAIDTVTAVGTKAGESAITIVLSNDAHTLPTTSAGVVTYTGSGTTIQVWEGSSPLQVDQASPYGNSTFRVASAAGTGITPNTAPSGADGTYSRTYGDHTNMIATTAFIDYTIVVKNSVGVETTYVKRQTFSRSLQGLASTVITLNATSQAFSYLDGQLAAGQSDITLTAALQNSTDTVNWSATPSVTLTGTGNTRSLSATSFGANTQVTVTATAGGQSDSVTIVRLDGVTPPTAYSQPTEPTTRRSGDTWFYTGTLLLDTTRGTVVPNTGYTWSGTSWVMTTPRGTYIGGDGIYTGTLIAEQINTSGFTAQSANIATAAIDSAHINTAAITSVHIGTAQVDSLAIAGTAVTVPVTVTVPDSFARIGTYDYVGETTYYLTADTLYRPHLYMLSALVQGSDSLVNSEMSLNLYCLPPFPGCPEINLGGPSLSPANRQLVVGSHWLLNHMLVVNFYDKFHTYQQAYGGNILGPYALRLCRGSVPSCTSDWVDVQYTMLVTKR